MRIRISHNARYAYASPPRLVTQVLRATPRSHHGQRVSSWRIDVDVDCALRASEDAFGNFTHTFTAAGRLDALTVSVAGEVETFDTAGVATGAMERFPPELFLRQTELTAPDAALRALAADVGARGKTTLDKLHGLMTEVNTRLKFDKKAKGVGAAAALAQGAGACQDFAHVFICCARAMNIPARCVSGYFLDIDGPVELEAGHAWAEAYVEDLGWAGFDPVSDACPSESHVCVARGFDYMGAAPARGAMTGGGGETRAVDLRVWKI